MQEKELQNLSEIEKEKLATERRLAGEREKARLELEQKVLDMKLKNERAMEKEREEREIKMAGIRAKAEAAARVEQELRHEGQFEQPRQNFKRVQHITLL